MPNNLTGLFRVDTQPGGSFEFKTEKAPPLSAWDELQGWLVANVGSKEADECLALVERVIAERGLAPLGESE